MIAWLFVLAIVAMCLVGTYITSLFFRTPIEKDLTTREAFSDFRSDHKLTYTVIVLFLLLAIVALII